MAAKRDKSIPLRVTATEKRTIEKAATKAGLSTSAYLRHLALTDAARR
jgi:uncharacterized protein (DUF1778 family)